MTTATKEKENHKVNDKLVGVFPLKFKEGTDGTDGSVAIPDTIQIIPIGQWEHDLYGPIIITNQDIREFAQNFNAQIRKGVFITAGHEGYEELPAVGWFTSVEARDDGLWGNVEWNKLGQGTLSDKQFKFFSPEFCRDYEDPQTHQIYRNVLTGGALTKSPYFKELEAIVFSEKALKFNNMNLKDLLAKDITTLTDDEKAFIKEHASELSDEEKTSHSAVIDEPAADAGAEEEKPAGEEAPVADADAEAKAKEEANVAAGLNPDGSVKIEASEKAGMVMIKASALELLQEKADKGHQAFQELEATKLSQAVGALTFSSSNNKGKFLPKSEPALRKFMETLNAGQRTAFSALVAEIPNAQIFSETGDSTENAEGTAKAELESKINAKILASEGGKMKYSDAMKAVLAEDKGLNDRYNTEVASK